MEPLFIQMIADYGVGDPAFGEVIQKLYLLERNINVVPTSVPKFSTIATGFWTYQYAIQNPVPDMMIYTNTAPRKDKKESRDKNEGERLVFAQLKNGMKIVGVNAGYCFSLVKPEIEFLYQVNVSNKGSQFRSRDFYPEAVIGIARGKDEFIGETMKKDVIPEMPPLRIGWIDGYGNIKTTSRASDFKYKSGQHLMISLNGIKRPAVFTDGSFSVREGELAFAPGSSGGSNPFIEIFLRGLSAWREFGKPRVEKEFTVEVNNNHG
ncbi:hypothetical protein C4579_03370 [Candidatus Microgenomates bacterium]|nr:MAG: hypothetical protein C4579_03370 [Candidatus Microgenomates bacterium]